MPESPTEAKREEPANDPRWELVQRLAASGSFQRSWRLRELLLFVCERAIKDPEGQVREADVAAAVFGRQADFDTNVDTLVRVQASQLRKKLHQYFSSEGAAEPVVIEIPKGAYRPIFRERNSPGSPDLDASADIPEAEGGPPGRLPFVLGALLVLALAGASWLYVQNRALTRRVAAAPAPPRTGEGGGAEPAAARTRVDALWRQMFGTRQTSVVLSDGSLTVLSDVLNKEISLTDYERRNFVGVEPAPLKSDLWLASRLMARPFTSITDADVARRVGVLNAAQGIPTAVMLAREADRVMFTAGNVVLLGPRRANPWLELFESRLNFQSRFDEDKHVAYFENTAPRTGESATYVVAWKRLGYCRVAYLPNLDQTGSVLLITGMEMSSSTVGADFLASEAQLEELAALLGVGEGQPFPHFEVLLRLRQGSSERIAHRALP